MYDNYDAFCQHQAQQDRQEREWLARLPECSECGEKITDDECYEMGDYLVCLECIGNFKVRTENYMRG